MDTLYLLPQTWDLEVDSSGNIAMATIPYSLAQDAASALKTFSGEVFYNTQLGIPFFEMILGKSPPLEYIRSQFIQAALTVPGVVSAKVFFTDFSDRQLSGQVQITSATGQVSVLGF